MYLYRLLTENNNQEIVINCVADYFDCFTISEQIGYWKGKRELSLSIEIITDDVEAALKIAHICKSICIHNNQEAILVCRTEVDSNLIGQSGVL